MALTTRYPGKEIIIAEDPQNIVFGTVMLGDAYGEVVSATVTREADIEDLLAGASLLAVILRNPTFSFKFKTMFRDDVTPPGIGDLITFPLAGIQGRILPPISIDWEEKGHRQLSIEAKSWDQFEVVNQGGGNAYTFDGTTYTPLT